MKPFFLCAATLAFTLSAAAVSPNEPGDLAARIRAVADEHNDSTVMTPKATYYSVVPFKPPRGYRTTITLVNFVNGGQTITTTVYETIGGVQCISLLVDEHADGHVEYVLTAKGRTLESALAQLRSGHASSTPASRSDQAFYDVLVAGLRAEVANPNR